MRIWTDACRSAGAEHPIPGNLLRRPGMHRRPVHGKNRMQRQGSVLRLWTDHLHQLPDTDLLRRMLRRLPVPERLLHTTHPNLCVKTGGTCGYGQQYTTVGAPTNANYYGTCCDGDNCINGRCTPDTGCSEQGETCAVGRVVCRLFLFRAMIVRSR